MKSSPPFHLYKAYQTFNAVLIGGMKEDAYLNPLENESHTELTHDYNNDPVLQKLAKRFINNLSKALTAVIDEAVKTQTSIQMSIQTTTDISFRGNEDINGFYREFKEDIVVPKHALLGFSNTVIFEGSSTKPYGLFERKIDTSLKSDI